MIDYQIALPERSLTTGPGTAYTVRATPQPVGFINAAETRQQDSPSLYQGDAFGVDRYLSRVLRFTVAVTEPTPAETRQTADVLRRAWRLSTSPVRLDAQFPGSAETVLSFFGRPRNFLESGDWQYPSSLLAADLSFAAYPFAFGIERTETSLSGSFTLPLADMGDVGTRSARATITVHGNGGTPVIVNNTDSDRDITFTGAVSGTVTLDLLAQTATQTTTNDVIGQISSTSWWPELVGGVGNDFAVSGCTGIDITWRPAYY